jgi:hypothetical protein
MATDSECVGYARECVRLAGMTTDPQLRGELLKIAHEWRAMARARTTVLRSSGAQRAGWELELAGHVQIEGWFGASPPAPSAVLMTNAVWCWS